MALGNKTIYNKSTTSLHQYHHCDFLDLITLLFESSLRLASSSSSCLLMISFLLITLLFASMPSTISSTPIITTTAMMTTKGLDETQQQQSLALHFDHIQRFSIHSKEDCSDGGEFYIANVKNLNKMSSLVACGTMKCFCTWHGMWIFTSRNHYKSTFRSENSGRIQMLNHGKICESRKINWSYFQLGSIRHVGHSNDSLPGLSLYREAELFGPELYLTASSFTSLSLPISKTFHSYGLTGKRRWSLFSNTNFTGNITCIKPSLNSEIIFEPKVTLVVGSIQSGCTRSSNNRNRSESLLSKRRKFSDTNNIIALYKDDGYKQRGMNNTNNNTQKKLKSESSLIFDGGELRLSASILFYEYSIIGSESWTIYSGTEFNGKCQCLFPVGGFDRSEGKRQFDQIKSSSNYTSFSTMLGSIEDEVTKAELFINVVKPTVQNKLINNVKIGRIIGSLRQGCFPCTKRYLDQTSFDNDEDDYENHDNDDDGEDEDDYYDLEFPINEIIQVGSNLTNGTDNSDISPEESDESAAESSASNSILLLRMKFSNNNSLYHVEILSIIIMMIPHSL